MYVLKNTRFQLQKEKMAVMAVAQEKEISELLSLKNIYEKIKNERDFFMFECTSLKASC